MTTINPLPLDVICVERGGVRLSDGQTSDVWTHPALEKAIASDGEQVQVSVNGTYLSVRDKDGRLLATIAGEELVSSMHRCIVSRKTRPVKTDPYARRAHYR